MLAGQGHETEAVSRFGEQLRLMPDDHATRRFRCLAYYNMADAQALAGHYAEAERSLLLANAIFVRDDLRDGKVEVQKRLARLYEQWGHHADAQRALLSYYSQRDSMDNYRMVSNAQQMTAMSEIRHLGEQMSRLHHRHQLEAVALTLSGVIIIIVAIFLLLLWRKNRRLQQRNRALYQRSLEMMETQEQQRQQRQQAKYGHNKLDDDNLDDIWQQVMRYIDISPQIYDPDFKIDMLAQAIGAKSKHVSQAINERYKANFTVFLNDQRVREACRRINDPSLSADLTLEGIAQSVGIKSRTTFSTAFKRVTGLTPSEYLKLARSRGSS